MPYNPYNGNYYGDGSDTKKNSSGQRVANTKTGATYIGNSGFNRTDADQIRRNSTDGSDPGPSATYYADGSMKQYDKSGKVTYTESANPLLASFKNFISSVPRAYGQEDYLTNMQDQINSMYDQQRQAQLNQLKASRDKAIGEINQQKANTSPMYQNIRNQTDAVNIQNVQKLREVMANAGLSATGENVTANVQMSNERAGDLNNLNLQEQQTMNDYNRRITDLQNPADENAIMAALEAERSKALLQGEQTAYNRSRDTVMDNRYLDELIYNRNQSQKQWDYNTNRDAVEDARWNKQFESDKAWREYTYNNMSASERAQLEWAKSQYGEDAAWKMFELKYNGELNKSLAQSQLSAYNSGFNNAQEGDGYNNYYKTSQLNNSKNKEMFSSYMNQAVKMGVPQSWVPALTELVGRESSWNATAKNPTSTAFGYGQFLKSTRANYEKKTGLDYNNPVHQLVMMAEYVKDRYGTPQKALAFWDSKKYY